VRGSRNLRAKIGGACAHLRAQVTMREVQGGIIGSAFIIMAFALSGLLRAVLHYISPLTVAVNIAIVGLSLFASGFRRALLPQLSFALFCTLALPLHGS
jgi:xanthine/uracil permease